MEFVKNEKMKKSRIGLGMLVMMSLVMTSCSKEEEVADGIVEDPELIEPSNTELITGSYSIALAVVNGDTIDPNAQWMDQTFVVEQDGTGAQMLHVGNDSITLTFEKPLEWYFNESEELWNMRTKELDDNGNPVEEWDDWVPYDVLKLTNKEFWYGLSYPEFSVEFHLEKIN